MRQKNFAINWYCDVLSKRPLAKAVPLGTRFLAFDERTEYVCAGLSNDASTHSWVAVNAEAYASPVFYVASTGSDTNPGLSTTLPLRTVAEALRRLSVNGWTGSAYIRVMDDVNEGNAPYWRVPSPSGPITVARPICIESYQLVQQLAGTATGGSSSTSGPPVTLGTLSTGVPMAVNAHQGELVAVDDGPLAGSVFPIDANDGAGVLTLAGSTFGSAPLAGNAYRILRQGGGISYTDRLTIEGIVEISKLRLTTRDTVVLNGGIVQSSMCKFASAALTDLQFFNGALWYDGQSDSILPFTPQNAPVGSRWDGSAGAISPFGGNNLYVTGQNGAWVVGGGSLQGIVPACYGAVSALMQISGFSSFKGGSFTGYGTGVTVSILQCRLDACEPISLGVLEVGYGAVVLIAATTIVNTVSGDVIYLDFKSVGDISHLDGANAGATYGCHARRGSSVTLENAPTLTVGGGANFQCKVGSNAGTSFANCFAGTAALATDVNAGSSGVATSEMCRIGP